MRVAVRPCVVLEPSTGRSNLPGDLVSLGNAAAKATTFAPSLANAKAVALPMPEVPPVMRTLLFSKVFTFGLNVAKIDLLAKVVHLTKRKIWDSSRTESISKSGLTAGNRIRLRHIHAKVTIRSSGLPDHGAFIGTDPNCAERLQPSRTPNLKPLSSNHNKHGYYKRRQTGGETE